MGERRLQLMFALRRSRCVARNDHTGGCSSWIPPRTPRFCQAGSLALVPACSLWHPPQHVAVVKCSQRIKAELEAQVHAVLL